MNKWSISCVDISLSPTISFTTAPKGKGGMQQFSSHYNLDWYHTTGRYGLDWVYITSHYGLDWLHTTSHYGLNWSHATNCYGLDWYHTLTQLDVMI